MRYDLAAIVALCAGVGDAAQAQVFYPPTVSKADVTAAATAAAQAATPGPCPVPLSDTLIGSAGTQPTCMTRPDATRATVIQATTVITASDGSFTGTWPTPFTSAPTGRIADVEVTSASQAPYKCSFVAGSVTASSFAGKCWQIVATTLPTTATALLGLVVSPIQNAAAGLIVRVTGRQ